MPVNMPNALLNPQQSMEDFVQRFHGTYLKIKTKTQEKPFLVLVKDVKPGTAIGSYSVSMTKMSAGEKSVNIAIMGGEFEIVEYLPYSKYINLYISHGINVAAYFSRIPDRQYKRGCCGNTFFWWLHQASDIGQLPGFLKEQGYSIIKNKDWEALIYAFDHTTPWMDPHVQFLFDPIYPTFEKASNMVFSGNAFSCAFSKYYATAISFIHSGIDLCRKNVPIARITKQEHQLVITPTSDLFRQEISDLIRGSVITNSILV